MIALAGATSAWPADRQSAELRFAATEPETATGVTFNIDYVNPGDASAKPPAVRKVVLEFAPGTKIDTSVPERCTATDAELMSIGP